MFSQSSHHTLLNEFLIHHSLFIHSSRCSAHTHGWMALSPVWRDCPPHHPACLGGGVCVRNGGCCLCWCVLTQLCPPHCPHWGSGRCLIAETGCHLRRSRQTPGQTPGQVGFTSPFHVTMLHVLLLGWWSMWYIVRGTNVCNKMTWQLILPVLKMWHKIMY